MIAYGILRAYVNNIRLHIVESRFQFVTFPFCRDLIGVVSISCDSLITEMQSSHIFSL